MIETLIESLGLHLLKSALPCGDENRLHAVLHHHERVLRVLNLFNPDGVGAVGHERRIDDGG